MLKAGNTSRLDSRQVRTLSSLQQTRHHLPPAQCILKGACFVTADLFFFPLKFTKE